MYNRSLTAKHEFCAVVSKTNIECITGCLNKGMPSEDVESLFHSCIAIREEWSEKGTSFEAREVPQNAFGL